jgi:hypothetical protein
MLTDSEGTSWFLTARRPTKDRNGCRKTVQANSIYDILMRHNVLVIVLVAGVTGAMAGKPKALGAHGKYVSKKGKPKGKNKGKSKNKNKGKKKKY